MKRLQLSYVDILHCHRPDPEVPMEEVVFAIDYILRSSLALYWGTSMWSARELEAHKVCKELGCMPPHCGTAIVQHVDERKGGKRIRSYLQKVRYGLTTFNPLAGGILTNKYNNGMPEGSGLACFPHLRKHFEEQGILSEKTFARLRKLQTIADTLGVSMSQLAIAWCLKNDNASSVILGVSGSKQLTENLKALEIKKKLDDELMKEIEKILES